MLNYYTRAPVPETKLCRRIIRVSRSQCQLQLLLRWRALLHNSNSEQMRCVTGELEEKRASAVNHFMPFAPLPLRKSYYIFGLSQTLSFLSSVWLQKLLLWVEWRQITATVPFTVIVTIWHFGALSKIVVKKPRFLWLFILKTKNLKSPLKL